jgi:hypothetical protein
LDPRFGQTSNIMEQRTKEEYLPPIIQSLLGRTPQCREGVFQADMSPIVSRVPD